MAMDETRECPTCGSERTFYRAASTTLHLGEKVKWHCPDCDWGYVRINDAVDSGSSSA